MKAHVYSERNCNTQLLHLSHFWNLLFFTFFFVGRLIFLHGFILAVAIFSHTLLPFHRKGNWIECG